jgi:hypothetical protein
VTEPPAGAMDIVDPVSTREHAGPIATARAAFKTHGRGFIVSLDDRKAPHYSTSP